MAKTKSTHVEQDETASRDKLATFLQKALNGRQKDGQKVAYFLDEKEDPSNVIDWVSTGCTMLDLAICNRPNAGLPAGRISEFNGLESCVTEDTEIAVRIGDDVKILNKFKIGDVKPLMEQGIPVAVLTVKEEFVKITKYVEKGLLDTFEVFTEYGNSIKVSREHRFFTNDGWVECKDLIPGRHSIFYREDGYTNALSFWKVTEIFPIGKHNIVDITVDHPDHCYFGNGMLNHNSGKSLLCAHIIAETQKKGGFAVMLDPEYAAAPDFWTALGVSVKDLLYVPCSYLEEMLGHLEAIIGETRKENPDRLVTIITDSIASVPTKKELEADYDAAGYGTDKSKLLSLAMRKLNGLIARQRICAVFTNQLRQNLKAVSFGDPYLEPGGMAFRYAASVRVRTKNVGRVSTKEKEVIGRTIQTQVTKTRFGPSFRTASFDIHYDSGIQNLASWLDYMKDHGLITGTKAGYTFKMCDNQILNANEFVRVANEQPEFKEKVYKSICDNYIMVYRPANSKIDESVEHLEGDGKDEEKVKETVE